MTEIQGQMSIFDFLDQDTWSGKTLQEPLVPTAEKISERSSKKPQKLQMKMPMFLDLRGTSSGAKQDASWVTDGVSLGECMMHSISEFHKDEREYVYLLTSMETQPQRYYLNCSEKPMKEVKSKLSWVLEKNPDTKYNLSEKACQGILNRASRRGKELPQMLKDALIRQATPSKFGGGTEIDSYGKKAGKGALVQTEMSGTIGVSQDQTLICFEPGAASRVDGHIYKDDKSGTIRANAGDNQQAVVYGISPYDSNAMKSANPHSGIYEADTSRTLDLNGGSPACNQGGMAVVYNGVAITSPINAANPKEGDPCHTLTDDSRNYVVQVETEVTVRKYPVDKKRLIKCLQEHKYISIREISERLNKPKTLVEHWFRKDKCFAIPDADIWLELKALLDIETDEFDESIMTFITKPGNYDMSNRIHIGEITPTVTASGENTLYCLEGNGQRESHKGDGYKESETMYTLNTVEQHGVMLFEPRSQDGVPRIYENRVCPTLNTAQGGQRQPCIVDDSISYQETVGTLSPGAHAGSYNGQDAYNDMLIVDNSQEPITMTTEMTPKIDENGVGFSLRSRDYKDPPVVTYQDRTGTVDCCISKGTSNQLVNNDMFVANTSVVRRLTPMECERLQGFPDHWTDIGEWIDSKGKKHKDADSPRYKALGNSIALPFWGWLAERIVAQYDRKTTMASLFDGIGGFPLVFSRCGCEPVWASEIEEFPIAVTKLRFGEDKPND